MAIMGFVRSCFAVLATGLAALIVWAMAADGRALPVVLSALLTQPWVVVTLADLYIGFFIAATIILLVEKRLWVGLVWALPVFVLGNVWTAIWLILRFKVLAARLRA